ncbi:MAG: hypothetical protein V8S98_10220 [Lachnospiraceae bacterium]
MEPDRRREQTLAGRCSFMTWVRRSVSDPEFQRFFKELLEEYFWQAEQLETEGRERMENAVRAYLEAGLNTREAARSLDHNTIRNRLEQFMTLPYFEKWGKKTFANLSRRKRQWI